MHPQGPFNAPHALPDPQTPPRQLPPLNTSSGGIGSSGHSANQSSSSSSNISHHRSASEQTNRSTRPSPSPASSSIGHGQPALSATTSRSTTGAPLLGTPYQTRPVSLVHAAFMSPFWHHFGYIVPALGFVCVLASMWGLVLMIQFREDHLLEIRCKSAALPSSPKVGPLGCVYVTAMQYALKPESEYTEGRPPHSQLTYRQFAS